MNNLQATVASFGLLFIIAYSSLTVDQVAGDERSGFFTGRIVRSPSQEGLDSWSLEGDENSAVSDDLKADSRANLVTEVAAGAAIEGNGDSASSSESGEAAEVTFESSESNATIRSDSKSTDGSVTISDSEATQSDDSAKSPTVTVKVAGASSSTTTTTTTAKPDELIAVIPSEASAETTTSTKAPKSSDGSRSDLQVEMKKTDLPPVVLTIEGDKTRENEQGRPDQPIRAHRPIGPRGPHMKNRPNRHPSRRPSVDSGADYDAGTEGEDKRKAESRGAGVGGDERSKASTLTAKISPNQQNGKGFSGTMQIAMSNKSNESNSTSESTLKSTQSVTNKLESHESFNKAQSKKARSKSVNAGKAKIIVSGPNSSPTTEKPSPSKKGSITENSNPDKSSVMVSVPTDGTFKVESGKEPKSSTTTKAPEQQSTTDKPNVGSTTTPTKSSIQSTTSKLKLSTTTSGPKSATSKAPTKTETKGCPGKGYYKEMKDSDSLLAVVITKRGGFKGRRINAKAIERIMRGKVTNQQVVDIKATEKIEVSSENSFVFPAGSYYFAHPIRFAGFSSP